MSFSSGVKEELAIQASQARHCRIALIAAMFHQCPVLTKDMAGIRTENEALVRAFENELRRAGFDPVRDEGSGSRISVVIHGEKKVRTFLEMIKLYDRIAPELCGDQDARELVRAEKVSSILLQKTCCRKAFLKGMFLAAGSVSDPAKSYHLEIAPLSEEDAGQVLKLMSSIGFSARATKRKAKTVVYLKEGEQISDFLGAIGATGSLMKLENARILRDIAGNINRQVNFEAANLKKTGIASLRQLEDIELIERTIGIRSLPPNLGSAALLRLENPDKSLTELAEASDPPVGRSGMNHRLQRIKEIADRIRAGESGSMLPEAAR